MSAAPATRNTRVSYETERLFLTGAIVVGATVPHWTELGFVFLALLAAAVAWRLGVALLDWPMAPRLLRLSLAFAAFTGVLFQYRTLNGVEAGSALLVVMVALKFLESRNQRDQLVLIMIAYFLMFAAVLTERGPLMTIYLVTLVWLATIALLQLGRRGALLAHGTTARLGGRLLLHALPLMIVLFLLFPRLPGPLWGIPGSTSSGASGLSDTMSPGDITSLGLSDEIAFRVQFLSTPPRANFLYWRGPTMTHFNGRTWSMQQGTRRGERVLDSVVVKGEPTDYRVTLEPTNRNWAFALDMPVRWSGERTLRMGSDYQLGTFFGPRGRRLDYDVTSYTDFEAREPLTPAEQQMFRALPEGTNPRTRALAESWLTDSPSGETIIERAMGYLRSQPFQYTLTPSALGAQPVDEFLFETREGFCEHYASALTVLLRAAGVPARVVTGYQGGELNSVGNYFIIRQSDAHAWTEAWLPDRGWVRVDGVAAVAPERVAIGSSAWSQSPATSQIRTLRSGWLRRTALLFDAINMRWRAWVVGYGPDLQSALLESLGIRNLRRAERGAVLFGLAVTLIIGVLLALQLQFAWRRRKRPRHDAAAEQFAAFTARLAKLAVPPRAPGEAPEAYAARAARTLPEAAEEIAGIVGTYLRARYEPDPERNALEELRTRIAAFRPRPA